MNELIIPLLKMVDQVRSNPMLIIDAYLHEPGISEEELDQIEQSYSVKLPGAFRSFYKEVGKLTLVWRLDQDQRPEFLREPEEAVGGVINLLDPDTMLVDKSGNFWRNVYWFPDRELPQNELRKKYRPFDHHGVEMAIGLVLEDKEFVPGLYLYDQYNGISLFENTLEDHLRNLVRFKGFEYWPKAMLNKRSDHFEKMNYYLPFLFPGDNM